MLQYNDLHMNGTRIHFVGIGGIGISGLARLFLHEGKRVSGSDRVRSDITVSLQGEGADISYEHKDTIIYDRKEDIDLVVYSDGITKDTEGWIELQAAREVGIETISYFEALGRVSNDYYVIAVAGTHGKTTTTAMLVDILEEANFDPTAIVGSLRSKTGSNYRAGESKYFVVEADEYMRHFLNFTPDVLIITNIDHDHVDYYSDLADVQSAFRELVEKVPEAGVIVTQPNEQHIAPVLVSARATIIDYQKLIDLSLRLQQPGFHNRLNAASASAAAAFLGIQKDSIETALENFTGTARRFEYKGDCNGARVYDDYAHNPQKVKAAIAGARELNPDKDLIVIFQPHTYSRTKGLFTDFMTSLATADHVILVPIYAAREYDDGSISSEMIVDALISQGRRALHFCTFEAAVEQVKVIASKDTVILVIGAGDVTKIAQMLVR